MTEWLSRTELIFGSSGIEKLLAAKIAVFGLGGVGGYAVEALARSGVGEIDLFDNDTVCMSNINRQIYATRKTLGMYKVDAAKERILEINPEAVVNVHRIFYIPETSGKVDLSQYDYVIDAIDTVSGKIELVIKANERDIPIISSMGAGNKTDASAFRVADIYETSVCPLAKVMRHELRKRGIRKLKVVYSKEPVTLLNSDIYDAPTDIGAARKRIPGSNSFAPPAAGLIMAGEVVKHLTGYGM